ncbi:hypothetical protein SCHPADRAFT_899123 [Schizopora paradoxa]|uniref:Uncharacterized protein n=1 Tax=Schizopora paradoxa TaxID=27342 RepID=A0A0H2SPM3_9AGAM|nr:hypothetical protein SCHPADRAFT_899123 [Schizopora paradoxa]
MPLNYKYKFITQHGFAFSEAECEELSERILEKVDPALRPRKEAATYPVIYSTLRGKTQRADMLPIRESWKPSMERFKDKRWLITVQYRLADENPGPEPEFDVEEEHLKDLLKWFADMGYPDDEQLQAMKVAIPGNHLPHGGIMVLDARGETCGFF